MARGDLRPGELGRGSAVTVGLSWMVDWGGWAGEGVSLVGKEEGREILCMHLAFIY